MEYQVRAYGNDVQSTHRTKAAAIKVAKELPVESEAKVVAREVSGTYRSHTCVWPVRGETYSN